MGRKTVPEPIGQPVQYDPDFQGPIKKRSCTDIICLLLFLVFLGCWIALGAWAIKKGDPEILLVPKDSYGLRCGLDNEVKDNPYLFFFDLTKCVSITTPFTGCDTPQICVKQCPDVFYTLSLNGSDKCPQEFCRGSECPTWIVPSSDFQKRCIPSLSMIQSFATQIQVQTGPNENFISDITNAIGNIKLISDVEQIGQQVIADVVNCWWKILIGVGLALLACLIYIFMLRWIAGVMVWFSIGAVVAALSAGIYFSATFYVRWRDDYVKTTEPSSKTKRDIFLGILIIVATFLAIVLLILLFLRKRIAMAIALVKEGSKAVGSVTSVLFFPILPWILQLGVVAYAIGVGVYLATVGEPLYRVKNVTASCNSLTENDLCYPANFTTDKSTGCESAYCKFISISNQDYYPYFQAFNIFEFFWLAFFVSALGQMVLAQVFAKWYWTKKKSSLPFFAVTFAFGTTFRYHLGTIAFGSLIIAICRIIRLCLEYIDKKLKKYDNELVKAILCCLKCFFWCLEKFLKFINKNAYIMCAIHGKNFCTSAKDAFSLLVRNIVRVFVLDKITDFLFFISKLVVTLGVGAVAYIFFASDLVSFMDNSGLKYGIVPVIIIMVVTYLIATLFFNVYSMAVDTLFLCFLEDIERNNGKDRPYFMSRSLMKIFGKQNKTTKTD